MLKLGSPGVNGLGDVGSGTIVQISQVDRWCVEIFRTMDNLKWMALADLTCKRHCTGKQKYRFLAINIIIMINNNYHDQ